MHLGTIRSQNQGGGVKTVFVARGTTLPIKKNRKERRRKKIEERRLSPTFRGSGKVINDRDSQTSRSTIFFRGAGGCSCRQARKKIAGWQAPSIHDHT